jgi:hypothetical protein
MLNLRGGLLPTKSSWFARDDRIFGILRVFILSPKRALHRHDTAKPGTFTISLPCFEVETSSFQSSGTQGNRAEIKKDETPFAEV